MKPSGKSDGRVLDANLALLLRRAYVPVLPQPAFRERLAREWGEGARALARRRAREHAAIVYETDPLSPRGPRGPRGLRPSFVLAVAAALSLVVLGPWLLERLLPAPPATPGALLARGAVALRALDGSAWSALAEGVDGFELSEPGLELFTPAGRTLRVLAPDGSLTIAASTHASIAADASGLAVHLDGELVAERRGDPERTWLFEDERASVRLDEGRLELELRRAAGQALLAHGSASFELADGEPRALAPGELVTLFPPPPAAGLTGDAPLTAAGERRPVDGGDGAGEGAPPRGEPAPGFVGEVRDAHSDAPITAFRVALLAPPVGNDYREPSVRACAAPDGAFRWSDHPRGTVFAFVHADGYAVAALGPHDFDGERDTPLGTVRLSRGGSVRGFVVDAHTGNPLSDALVLSERDAPSFGLPFSFEQVPHWLATHARTRSDGSFELEHASVGEHVLRVSLPGHAPLWIPRVAVGEGETVDLGTRALGAGGRLEGTVRLPDGAAFAGAHLVVTVMDDSSAAQMNFALLQTDLAGHYAVDDLPPGQLLAVFLGDFREPPKVRPIRIEPSTTTVLDFPDQAPLGTRLFGRLLRGDGEPLAQRNLTLIDSSSRSSDDDWVATTSDAAGNYAFESVQAGSYALLEVDSFGRWLALIATLDVPAWPEFELDVRRLDSCVEGRAVADASDEPVSTVLVLERIEGTRRIFAGFVRSASDGGFALRGLPEGRYELTSYATHDSLGYEAAEPFVLDAASPSQTIVFRHAPGAIVDVSVVDANGMPLSGARIEFQDERGRPFSFEQNPLTDDQGRHTAAGVRPGRFRVCASRSGYDDGCADIECRAGARDALRIRLSAQGK